MEQLRAKEAEVKAQVVGARVRVLFGGKRAEYQSQQLDLHQT